MSCSHICHVSCKCLNTLPSALVFRYLPLDLTGADAMKHTYMNICLMPTEISIKSLVKQFTLEQGTKMYKLAFPPIEDSDQPVHRQSLIRVFDGRSMDSLW